LPVRRDHGAQRRKLYGRALDRILAIQTCDDGYDYTLINEHYVEIDGGQVDNPDMSMIEVRLDILESFGLAHRELRAMVYEDVMEEVFQVARQATVVDAPAKKESVMGKLAEAAEKIAPPTPSQKHKEPER